MEPVMVTAGGYSIKFIIMVLPIVILTVIGVVVLIKLLNSKTAPHAPASAGDSPTRAERTSLLRERRDRYQQERTRILGMVDKGQVSAAEAALLLDSVERETTTMACPFCSEDIRVEALKCHHCGQYLVEEDLKPRRLTRSSNKMLAGVCAGVAEYTGLDVSLVRILVVLVVLATGIVYGLLIYLVAALVMPES
jgi:phage shock protein C